MSLRLVSAQELNIDESKTIGQWLDDAEAAIGVYSDLEQRRVAVGADLVVMFRQFDTGDTCGLAGIGGDGTEGLMSRTTFISASFIDFDACGDLTMIHEVGHNIGLGHSFRQNDTGTFIWARGHGIDDGFTTLMAYGASFDNAPELPLFSNPNVALCDGSPCGIAVGQPESAFSAKSINVVRFQVAAFTPASDDADNDGVPDSSDAFPLDASETADTDGDGVGDNADAFPLDSSESVDTDNDGVGNNVDSDDDGDGVLDQLDSFPLDATRTGQDSSNSYLGRSYHMTNSQSPNLSETQIINSSGSAQAFTGTLYHKSGDQLGAANVALHAGTINSQGRVILSATDLQTLFDVEPWTGPAILDIQGTMEFDVMSKLSRNGRVTNTNCVRSGNAQNVEGSDSTDIAYVRFINDGFTAIPDIRGTLYDADGNTIGQPDAQFFAELGPREAVFKSQGSISNIIGSDWPGRASLVLSTTYDNLRLMNLNFVNNEIYFNFSCYLTASDQGGN
jgi:hypothetical protein